MKRLFLLDGMALVYRAHFVFLRNPRINSKGMNTSAVFGWVNALLQTLEKGKPTHLAVAFDTPEPTQRHIEFDGYKAHRQEMPEDLSAALPYVFKVTEGFNIPVLRFPGYEADDVIGTLSRRAEREGFVTYMVTPDKDYCQLVDENTYLFKPAKGGEDAQVLGVREVLDEWGIERVEQVIDILGLWGDAVDNIPGIPGIGEKTAKTLIAKYGSVEGLIAHVDELKGKQQENVRQFAEQGLMSKRLATINCEVPVNLDLESLAIREPNREALTEIFTELEFQTLGKRIFGSAFSVPVTQAAMPLAVSTPASAESEDFEASENGNGLEGEEMEGEGEDASVILGPQKTIADVPHDYRIARTREERASLIAELFRQPAFCFDSETTGLERHAGIIGLAFSFAPHTGWYVPIPDDRNEAQSVLDEFRPLFEDKNIEKVGHNLKFDLGILQRYGIAVCEPLFDTMLAHVLVEPSLRHGMDFLSQRYLGYTPISISSLIGERGSEQLNMRDVDIEKVGEYAAEDADVTWQLREFLIPILRERNAERIFREVECPLVPALAKMELEGVRLDSKALRDFSAQLDVRIAELEAQVFEAAGTRFHLDSPKQLGDILFNVLKLEEKTKKTKTGQFSTNERVLSRLAAKHEIVRLVLEYRECRKLKSTYVDMLPNSVSHATGRVHTHYSQLITATGRIQSASPNLQNIPIKTERGKEIRRAFVPRGDGYLILAADYSQIELRIVAELSQDPGMMNAFEENKDIHRETAARVFGVSPENVTEEMRRKAKMVNFGVTYGMTAFGLAERLNIPRGEASSIINAYFSQYPGVQEYMNKAIASARERGYAETVMGRRRYLRDINSANATTRQGAERLAVNMPIQGTAADMIKIAMANIYKDLAERDLKTLMILQIHDELVFDLWEEEGDLVLPLVEDRMKNALVMTVPIGVEMGVGKNWLEAH